MTDAYHCYARWGAKAKTDRLEATYPQLLTSILQPYSCDLDSHSSHRSSQSSSSSSQRSSQSSSSSHRSSQSFGTIATVTSLLDLNSAIKASRAISGEIELNALLSKLMYLVLENAGADTGALLLNSSGSWVLAAWCDRDRTDLPNTPFEGSNNLPSSIINTVKRTQQPILIHHVEKDPTFAGDPYLIERPPQCLLCTPILHISQLIGILYLENHLTPEAFTPGRIELLNLLIAQAAISIKNAKLYEQVEHYAQTLETQVEARTQQLVEANIILRRLANLDGLTQVANRRSFDTYLREVWLQAEQTQQPLTLMLSDVDCFKLYNDRYGHQAGDRVLQQIAKTLEQAVAEDPTAQVARYGGEEFAVILPRTDRLHAIAIADRIQIAIRSLAIPHEQSLVKEYVTLSMGVCSLVPNSELNWPRLIQMADEALYAAKQQGRDRFVGRWLFPQN